MTVEEIRAKYPNAISADDRSRDIENQYCVLGAACSYAREFCCTFPLYSTASQILGISYEAARNIATLNDNKQIEEAWAALDVALKGE